MTKHTGLTGNATTVLAALLALEGCGPTTKYSPNEKLGFPVAAAAMNAPNGLADDPGWANSFKFFLEDGASVSAAYMRGVSDAQHVYLYIDAEDPQFGNTDTVVVAFNPDNAPNHYYRMQIYPCRAPICSGVNNESGITPTVDSWTGVENGASLDWTAGALPGVTVSRSSAPGSPGRWGIEIRLDRANYAFPATGFFGLYVNAIATDPGSFGVPANAVQYSWPLGNIIGAGGGATPTQMDIDTNKLLPIVRWGNATIDPAAFPAGLQITGFSSAGADPSKISRTQPNEFFGTGANIGGGPAATGVRARFQINNIGLNPPNWTWTDIPSSDNPSPLPGETINAGEYVPYSSGTWSLTGACCWQTSGKTDVQFFTDNDHQCIKVDLFTGANTTLVSRYFNMEFVDVNSPFASQIQIGTGVWRKNFPEARGASLREVFFNAGDKFNWESRFEGAEAAGPRRWNIRSQSFAAPTQMLRTSVLPGEGLQVPAQQYKLDPVELSRGGVMDVAVKPGSVLTLLAEGEASVHGRPVSASGLSEKAAREAQVNAEAAPDALRPGSKIRAGALLGSFDGFKTSFAIGSGTTLFVPYDAQRLQVRFGRGVPFERGGFVLRAVATAPNAISTDGLTPVALRRGRGPVLLPLGNNLPMHVVRGALDTGQVIVIGGQRFTAMAPMGSYGSIVRSVGEGSTNPVPPRPDVVNRVDVARPVIR